MKILLFGATGKTGRHVLTQAAAAGHHVTAIVRSRDKLGELATHAQQVIELDITQAPDEALRAALEGADAVINVMGYVPGGAKDVLTQTATRLLPAMERAGVKRLITLVGAGVFDARDRMTLGRRFMRGAMKTFVPHILKDAEQHAELVRATALDWIIARPPRLTDGAATGRIQSGYLELGPVASLTRADLATFLLSQLTDATHVRSAPMVTNG